MDLKAIAVIGAWQMGREIAYAAALAGYRTILEDVSPTMLEDSVAYIRATLEEEVASGRATAEQRDSALANLSTARSVEDACRQADLLIETVVEELEVKLEIFTIFDRFAKPGAILASTTRLLSIADLAGITFRAENCAGMRFFHPVPKTKMVEIVRTPETSDATVAACEEVGRRMGKEVAVVCESPEFIPSRGNAVKEAQNESR
jgi:3-hydroxybutyryl-CoA dehydrogenase